LARWARQYDLLLEGQIGMSYSPITQHYWLDTDVSVNYLMHTIKAST